MHLVGFSLAIIGLCDIAMSLPSNDLDYYSSCSNIIEKSDWGGQQPTSIDSRDELPYYVMFDQTNTPECQTFFECSLRLRLIQDFHMKSLGWADIGYSFLIGGDGRIYQGRGWHAHNEMGNRWYTHSVTIGFLGNFMVKDPKKIMKEAAREIVNCGKARGFLPDHVKVIAPQQVLPVRHPSHPILSIIKKWPEWMEGSP